MISGGYSWGGSEELWSGAAQKLKEAGHDVFAVVSIRGGLSHRITALRQRGVTTRVLHSTADTYLQRVKRKISSEAGYAWVKRLKPDLVVISQGAISGGLPWIGFCAREEIPYAIVVQANSEGWWLDDQSAAEVLAGCRAARRIFFVSQRNQLALEMNLGIRLGNAAIARNPWSVNPAKSLPWPGCSAIARMACVGRLQPSAKGQDILLEVLSRPKWRLRPIHLNFYGEGPCEGGLRSLVKFFELANVQFRGQVTNIADIWLENEILVLPSRHEGLPLVLVEAMLSRRAAVVTDVGGNTELCIEGQTGFIAPAAVPDAFDEALERAWTRREEWQAIGEAAFTYARNLLPEDPIAEFCAALEACVTLS